MPNQPHDVHSGQTKVVNISNWEIGHIWLRYLKWEDNVINYHIHTLEIKETSTNEPCSHIQEKGAHVTPHQSNYHST